MNNLSKVMQFEVKEIYFLLNYGFISKTSAHTPNIIGFAFLSRACGGKQGKHSCSIHGERRQLNCNLKEQIETTFFRNE